MAVGPVDPGAQLAGRYNWKIRKCYSFLNDLVLRNLSCVLAVCCWTLQIVHQKYNVCILYVCLFCHISIGGSFPPEVSVPESLLRRNSSLSASLKTRICQRRLCYFHRFVELCYFYWIETKTWRRSEARLSACTVSWSRGQAWPSR